MVNPKNIYIINFGEYVSNLIASSHTKYFVFDFLLKYTSSIQNLYMEFNYSVPFL